MQRSFTSIIGGIHCRPALNEIAEEIELVPMANKIMQRGTTVDRSGVVYSDLLQHPVDQIEVQRLVLRVEDQLMQKVATPRITAASVGCMSKQEPEYREREAVRDRLAHGGRALGVGNFHGGRVGLDQ